MNNSRSPHIPLAHDHWRGHLRPCDVAVDMTCGNGRDTLVLSECVPQGLVYAFDIQEQAIEQTRKYTSMKTNVRLIHSSHSAIDQIPFPIAPRLIVYNLGYLPGGDKSLVTRAETTLESLIKAMNLLADDGAISITCYPGHEEGAKEEQALQEFFAQLPSHLWTICHHTWVNRPKSPTLFLVQK